MKVTFGTSFNLSEPAKAVAEYVRVSEELGFTGISWITDSQCIWRDVYVALTLATIGTKTIKIGTGVTNPVTRSPTVTCSAIATIDELSGGRAVLGMGAGDSSVHTMGLKPATIEELRESIIMMRTMLSGGELDVGKPVRIGWIRRSVPIYLAATGPRSLQLAGELADGVIINVGANAKLINWAMDRVKAGANIAGRSMKGIDLWLRLMVSLASDEETARKEVKGIAATVANTLSKYCKDGSLKSILPSGLMEDLSSMERGYDYYHHERSEAPHTNLLTERIIDNMTVAGRPDQCISRIESIVKSTGLTQVSLGVYGFSDTASFLGLFASAVIPHFTG